MDVDNSQELGKLPGCEMIFPAVKMSSHHKKNLFSL